MLRAGCSAQKFVEKLHNSSRRFVPILDPGIPVLPGYNPYEDGIKQDIFIRDVTGQPYIGEVCRICFPSLESNLRSVRKQCCHVFLPWQTITQGRNWFGA